MKSCVKLEGSLALVLKGQLPNELIVDLAKYYSSIRIDYEASFLETNNIGKFIETVVQVLDYIELGKYDEKKSASAFLDKMPSRKFSKISDSLKLCLSRVALSVYSIRNNRNIAHKSSNPARLYDLKFCFYACQWLLTELIDDLSPSGSVQFSDLTKEVQKPASILIEEVAGSKVVLKDLSIPDEIIVLLASEYPKHIEQKEIRDLLKLKKKSSISIAIKRLEGKKCLHINSNELHLTKNGLSRYREIVNTYN